MLPTTAVEAPTLELIKSLQDKPYLQGFYLVGGTALALSLGHRKSVDIDLFSNFSFDASELLEQLHQDFPYQLFLTASNTLKGAIGNINVDILAHRYKLISKPIVIQSVTLLSLPDIIAMKLNAISTSGQRSKDFIDIYYLLNEYNLVSMLEFYQNKYDQMNVAFILKSLIYFEDIDLSDWPVLIKHPGLKWSEVRNRIEKVVLEYVKNSHY
ncbi:MAG: nucleotidyl transferase AbiEii/AbiGii toxin family protein [Bacteroidales bacterium]|nr:nucleotidyl transferase AbiEii/AbiGii toxin family protein [Lentimicrobiaceae bacterium]MDD5695591.1 nucleotidyl transferase AbiEii/AbiGii toxin family protein [Bacteroidales bacterium]